MFSNWQYVVKQFEKFEYYNTQIPNNRQICNVYYTIYSYICNMFDKDGDSIESIGKKLEQLRLNLDYSQGEVSKQIGVSRKTLSTLENGGNFSVLILVKLLRLYGKLEDLENILSLPGGFDMNLFQKELKKSKKRYATHKSSKK